MKLEIVIEIKSDKKLISRKEGINRQKKEKEKRKDRKREKKSSKFHGDIRSKQTYKKIKKDKKLKKMTG